MNEVQWDIRAEGRAWPGEGGEALSRYYMTPEKIEMVAGKLFLSDESRLTMLALLLENVGADQAVRIGDPVVVAGCCSKVGVVPWRCPKIPTPAGTRQTLP